MKNKEFERMAAILRPDRVPKKNAKIYKKETIHRGMHVMICPLCNCIAASSSDKNMLPNWSMCNNEDCIY